ncbi:Hypothetical protein D9617_22g066860 [Elsinoe fawcettii]|nr:Hypothetical protein D9617_22g066860 [Elsinoe fawcettii]
MPTVTVGFTTHTTSTLTFEPVSTYHKTETTVSTITKTVTEAVKDSIWTTTSTVHIYDRRYVNITDIHHSVSVSSEPYYIHLQIPTMEGWVPVNTSTRAQPVTRVLTLKDGRLKTTVVRPTSSRKKRKTKASAGSRTTTNTAANTDVAGPVATEQIIYILEQGRLVPTPLTAVSGLITATETSTATDATVTITDADGQQAGKGGDSPATTDTATEEVTTIPGEAAPTTVLTPEKESEAELVKQLLQAMSAAEQQIAAALPTDESTPVDNNRPDDERPLDHVKKAKDDSSGASATGTETDATGTATDKTAAATPGTAEEEFDDDEALLPDDETTATSTRPTATTIEIDATLVRTLDSIETPVEEAAPLRKRALTRVPRHYYGLRGAATPDPTQKPAVVLTQLDCTKFVYHETTVFAPHTGDPSFVPPDPVTLTTTTLKFLTVTSTMPSPPPSRTATHVTTTTVTTTTTYFTASTWISTQIHTVSSTKTALAACATQNLLGPKGFDDSHIVNVYSKGPYKYTNYDVGIARNEEECCAECHEMLIPCLGSIWDRKAQRCYLVSDWRSQCAGQGGGAGVFVTRPQGERQGRGRHEWPDWVISNGPCGYWVDGGTGW